MPVLVHVYFSLRSSVAAYVKRRSELRAVKMTQSRGLDDFLSELSRHRMPSWHEAYQGIPVQGQTFQYITRGSKYPMFKDSGPKAI